MKTLAYSVALLLAVTPAVGRTARHVLIVANNLDPTGELELLRYADDDGARFAELFSSAGARVELLTTMDAESQSLFPDLVGKTRPPTKERLAMALSGIFKDILQDRAEGMKTEFVFLFTGHGKLDDTGSGRLLLADGFLDREDIFRDIIAASPADFNHIIIDACHAYFMLMTRGEWRDDQGGEWARSALAAYLENPELLSRYPTTGVILSTAGSAEVHEWERYRAGIFSHELRSGLLGPADVSGDGRISYGELEAFFSAANAGVTNPRARIQVYLRPPAQDLSYPVMELGDAAFTHILRIPEKVAGRFQVEDERGMAYADWNKASDHQAYLALLYPPVRARPRYFVRVGEKTASVELATPAGGRQEILLQTESLLHSTVSASRGSVAESYRRELFSVPFGLAFAQGYLARLEGERLSAQRKVGESPSAGRHFLAVEYLLSGALLSQDNPAHGVRLAYCWTPGRLFFLDARLAWKRNFGGREANAHTLDDFELGLAGGIRWEPWPWLAVSIEAGAANHFLHNRRDKQPQDPAKQKESQDNLAPAFGLEAGARVRIVCGFFAEARAGAYATWASPEGSKSWYFVPAGVFGLGYEF